MEPTVSGNKPELLRYQPQLDGLRFVAVFGVLLDHFGLQLPNELHYGQLGVRLFFILSGYFITRSLWKEQIAMGPAAHSPFRFAGAFYLKRFFRIAPAYYFVLGLGMFLGLPEIREGILFHLTFLTNFFIVKVGYWPGAASHFWTLAVQEQFYLIWPFIILLMPRNRFFRIMGFLIIGAIFYRFVCIVTDIPVIAKWTMLPGCIDSFAAGAIVAGLREKGISLKTLPLLPRIGVGVLAIGSVVSARALGYLPESHPSVAITETLDGIFLIWAFVCVMDGLPGFAGKFLAWRPITFLGKISYGLYIYHVFVIVLLEPILRRHGWTMTDDPLVTVTILSTITIGAAIVSYYLLEMPFLRLKDHVVEWFSPKDNAISKPDARLSEKTKV
jgi:peptidoglycan/LPS O-acetylase OafA/YrhL